ncbi:LGFP repeat-containing protein [Rhodococcus jostii]|uniref:LGFP repeat-containing protein n=1 Tax=Rhodococcus jostii TaxID=132919 RepID=UPI00363613BD
MCGLILEKYKTMDGPRGSLGMPTSNEKVLPDQVGRVSVFEHGSIYWSPSSDAHPVWGRIGDKWGEKGWEGGILGYPITDELRNPDGRGVRQFFERGAVYWSPETDAHSVNGAILDKWASLGYESGSYGYPVIDEGTTPDNVGRFNHFRGGSIYWTAGTGAWNMPAEIAAVWSGENFEQGPLGYPIARPENVDPTLADNQIGDPQAQVTVVQRFQNGTVQAVGKSGDGYVTFFNRVSPAFDLPIPDNAPKDPASVWDVFRTGVDKKGRFGVLRRGYYDGKQGFGADKMKYRHNITNYPLFTEMLRQPDGGTLAPWSDTTYQYDMPAGYKKQCKYLIWGCEWTDQVPMRMGVDYRDDDRPPVAPKTFGLVTMYCNFNDKKDLLCPDWVNNLRVGGN